MKPYFTIGLDLDREEPGVCAELLLSYFYVSVHEIILAFFRRKLLLNQQYMGNNRTVRIE